MEEVTIRRVTDGDIDSLSTLYDKVWPGRLEAHQQKANFVIRESSGVSYCAEKNGMIIGGRTSFYMPVYYGNRPLKCVQLADSCIHPSCRRQGLFLKLNEAFLHDFFDETGGELVFNFSVNASRNAYEKLGWKYIQSLTSFTKIINPIRTLAKVRFDIRKMHGEMHLIEEEDSININRELFDIRRNLMNSHNLIYVNYDYGTLLWKLMASKGTRCLSAPGIGTVIYKIAIKNSGLKVILLGDMFLYDYDTKNIIKIESLLCEKESPNLIMGSFSLAHPLYNYYIGKRLISTVSPLNHGVKVVSEEMRNICLNPNNWAVSELDTDYF